MEKKEYCSLGIMSGTSLDGLDFSLIKTDGKENVKNLINGYFEFSVKFRRSIKKLIRNFNNLNYKKKLESNEFKQINQKFTELIIEKINFFFSTNAVNLDDIDIIGLHGNTLLHEPSKGFSIQLGNPKYLSNNLKKPIVFNFRDNDIKNHGQGAPLVPIYHKAIFSDVGKNIMTVNIGGISNFSLLIGKRKMIASDIGPGNKLIDDFCLLNFDKLFDKNGELSSKGKIIPELIDDWKKKKFLKKPFPISFDNSYFKLKDFSYKKKKNLDILRTLTFFSAYLISNFQKKLNNKIDKWFFSGGGTKNYTLMKDLKDLLGKENVFLTSELGFDPFFIESQAFAYIAVRTLKKLPSSFPETTGCKKSGCCGFIYHPS
ncbi:MAG: anhydro-N-acetylmuramic acid kinase [Pseudomonadota bacterium]|nr:anhydro-N-acetylmuramic acid kinase [Pseudomonadota bacterium]